MPSSGTACSSRSRAHITRNHRIEIESPTPTIDSRVTGLLIVNADDFGGNRLATDRILECFAAGAITSASAMVRMLDSGRAAELARSRRLPIGLHLNLTQEFEDPATPAAVRERQARAVSYFAVARRRRFTYNPLVSSLVKACVTDQIECFRELFGVEPTHIDGHNHAHLSPTALFALPKGMAIRTAESRPLSVPGPGALIRRARHAFIARRQLTTERFRAIDPLAAEPSPAEIEALLAHGDRHSLEIMTHPDRDRDYELLMSSDWLEALRSRAVGSFVDLRIATERHDNIGVT
jgi:predicted glycoside hydrolase/deacetylase ChbG (UPF0249 family)